MNSSSAATSSMSAFREVRRVQQSVLTRLERRTLQWLAVRLPGAIHSDHLTILALVAMVGAGGSYWLASVTPVGLLLAIACLAANWFGDSLDGTIARVRNQQRPRYGYYVDHVVDAVGTIFLFGGLALSGYMSPLVAATLLVAYFAVCLEVYLAAHSVGDFEMSFLGLGPTELRILLAVGNLALLAHPTATVFGHVFKLFDIGALIGACGLTVTFVSSAIRHTRELYQLEPRMGARHR
ncbi:MAG: CDP-alcohol phosphatidyltransferase family protein [Vicinamibacterales bacterium]